MTTSNTVWMEKADQAVADLSAGGLMQPELQQTFFRVMMKKSKILRELQNKNMSSYSFEIDNVLPDEVILQPGTESTVLPTAARSKLQFGKSILNVVELVGEVEWSYQTVEDNIERGTFDNLVVSSIGERVASNVEDIVISGDTSITVPAMGATDASILAWKRARMRKSFNGINAKITSRTVDAGGSRLNKNVLKAALQTMPEEFTVDGLKFYTNRNAVADFHDSKANRQTPGGDKAFEESGDTNFQGWPVVQIPQWPRNLGVNSNMTTVALFDPKTAYVGFHRQITLERDRQVRARKYIAVWSMRVGFQFAYEPGTLLITNVRADADI